MIQSDSLCRVYKKVIELWSALPHSLFNLHIILSQLERPGFYLLNATILVKFEEKLRKLKSNEMAGGNGIFSPLSTIKAANKKRKCH